MNSYETTATVQNQGQLQLAGVPFAPGTEVRVIVAPKRASGEEFARAWEQWCREIRNLPNAREITDDVIQQEIDDYRAGELRCRR
jgi:hypothetical protein